jgi:hypothetical protein
VAHDERSRKVKFPNKARALGLVTGRSLASSDRTLVAEGAEQACLKEAPLGQGRQMGSAAPMLSGKAGLNESLFRAGHPLCM